MSLISHCRPSPRQAHRFAEVDCLRACSPGSSSRIRGRTPWDDQARRPHRPYSRQRQPHNPAPFEKRISRFSANILKNLDTNLLLGIANASKKAAIPEGHPRRHWHRRLNQGPTPPHLTTACLSASSDVWVFPTSPASCVSKHNPARPFQPQPHLLLFGSCPPLGLTPAPKDKPSRPKRKCSAGIWLSTHRTTLGD